MTIVSHRSRHDAQRTDIPVVKLPGRRTLDGIVRAGALIALADGTVTSAERQALTGFLRARGLLMRFGRQSTLGAFERAIAELGALHLAAFCALADELRHLAGTPDASLVAGAASRVMFADGIAWPQETALIRIIEDRLGLAPPRPDGDRMAGPPASSDREMAAPQQR
jgi:tellurite resistance protein